MKYYMTIKYQLDIFEILYSCFNIQVARETGNIYLLTILCLTYWKIIITYSYFFKRAESLRNGFKGHHLFALYKYLFNVI